MSKIVILISTCILASISISDAVRCYQCAYIEGASELNPDCMYNVLSGSVHSGNGLACLKAEGVTTSGKSFIIRRSFRPGTQQAGDPFFPMGQPALTCKEAAQYGNRQLTAAALSVTVIGDSTVREVTSCLLCNDKDECNAAPYLRLNLFCTLAAAIAYLGWKLF